MREIDCIVIGAGPAGLAAARASARAGRSTAVLEKMDRPGRKLLITGGGRCNLCDPARDSLDALRAFGRGGEFLRDALSCFSLAEFLADLDVRTELDASDSRHYVVGGARRLLGALLTSATAAGACLRPRSRVRSLEPLPSAGWRVRCSDAVFESRRVILATGGLTYPSTGSSGDGYAWAENLGHKVVPPTPTLGALATKPNFAALAGVTVPAVEFTLTVRKRKAGRLRGTLLFTHRGVSGPAVLDLSLEMTRAAGGNETAELTIDFLPDVPREKLESSIASSAGRKLSRALGATPLPSRLVAEVIRHAGLDPDARVEHVSRKDLRALVDMLKSMRLAVIGVEDPERCTVTFGGVSTREIDPRTMESRLVPGLYFAGEIISVHGPCGGYNLLQAFSTGHVAGS
jgi:hypothetical protein